MPRVRQYAWRVLPLLLLLALYWPGLTNWFYQDDFGWLNLRREVHSFADLGPALFAPKAHGNMRPLGENAFWLVLSSIFGVNALPFRLCAFLTQIASMLLLGSIVARITGSRLAGCCAQILWIANAGLAAALSWTSIYNQLLSAFFFLLALYFFLRHIESGGTRFAAAHWLAFVLGLGALEINVVYPALALIYAWLFARPYVRSIVPMFLISALSIGLHFHFAPPTHDGVYALHLNLRVFSTFWTYWSWALGNWWPAVALLTLAIVTCLRRPLAFFGIAWFAITLSPYLPLPDHLMNYYLAVPSIGISIVGAWAIASAWRSSPVSKAAALVCVVAYLAATVPAAWATTRWNHERSVRVEDLVLGVREIHEAQPAKTILLDGVDSDLFWGGIVDVPFRALEIPHVYLAPGSEDRIQGQADLVSKFVLPQAIALHALRDNTAVVYRVDGPLLRNITPSYRSTAEAIWKPEPPRFINVGDDAYAPYLSGAWSPATEGSRTLRGTATVRMGGLRRPEERLYIGVYQTSPFQLNVRVNGANAAVESEQRGSQWTELTVPAPVAPEIEVSLSSAQPLKFGFLEIRAGR